MLDDTWSSVAQVIQDKGWIKGAFADHTGAMCLLGACGMAWHDDPWWFRADVDGPADIGRLKVLRWAIKETTHRAYGNISAFNDHPTTTLDTIQAVLAKAGEPE